MLHRSSLAAHQKFSSRTLQPKQVTRSLNVLKKTRIDKQTIWSKKLFSYFIRIFMSGLIILMMFLTLSFIKKNLSDSINLNYSYTFLVSKPTSVDIVSLRGSEKNVQVVSITHPDSIQRAQRYFPIDSSTQLDQDIELRDKATWLKVFAPWNRAVHTQLRLFDRVNIWLYFFSIDSANFQRHSIVEQTIDSAQLLATIQKYFSDTRLRELTPTIAVVNTTTQNGLAKQLADILHAWGYTVIQVDSTAEQVLEHSKLVGNSTTDTHPVKRLQLLLPEISIVQDDKVLRLYRTQLVLFIGNEYEAP